ncbi:hypothetical protein SAMN05444410_110107 [Hydrobacter penzbergensis]|uniref:Uncharacterized protein n=1 Tax=Hydrobacter penzbergensis TaxID=1235997 RepID=A0A8X8IGA8_9BACT|nr:hypothetical protein SAMN05444410_110107 [Hydrobacter penzbergensis]
MTINDIVLLVKKIAVGFLLFIIPLSVFFLTLYFFSH